MRKLHQLGGVILRKPRRGSSQQIALHKIHVQQPQIFDHQQPLNAIGDNASSPLLGEVGQSRIVIAQDNRSMLWITLLSSLM